VTEATLPKAEIQQQANFDYTGMALGVVAIAAMYFMFKQ
jgi:hypothetical protein